MINNFKDGVLNGLYDVRSEDFERCFHEELENDTEKIGVPEKSNKLKEFVNELFKGDENTAEKFNGLLRDFETSMFLEMEFWCKKYYKLGFCDSNMLKEETRNFINISNKVERKMDEELNSFFMSSKTTLWNILKHIKSKSYKTEMTSKK